MTMLYSHRCVITNGLVVLGRLIIHKSICHRYLGEWVGKAFITQTPTRLCVVVVCIVGCMEFVISRYEKYIACLCRFDHTIFMGIVWRSGGSG